MGAVAEIVLEDVAVVGLGDGGLRQLVVGTDEEPHGADEQTDGVGGVETEGLVGDDGHLGHLLHEILGDEGDDAIGAHEDGYLLQGGTGGQEFADGRRQVLEDLRLVVVGREEVDADEALVGAVCRDLLDDVGVGPFELGGLGLVD